MSNFIFNGNIDAKKITISKSEKELLEEFIEWARNLDKGVFYIFDNTEEAVKLFSKRKMKG